MKTKLLFWGALFFLFPLQIISQETTSIPLVLVDDDNDGPSQDGKDPSTPNQFTALQEGRVISVTADIDKFVSLTIKATESGEVVTNTRFYRSLSLKIEKFGTYDIILSYDSIMLGGHFSIQLSQQEAADIMLEDYKKYDSIDIFISNNMYNKGDTIHVGDEHWYYNYIIADTLCWVAFIDMFPDANLAHECHHILIDASTGDTSLYIRGFPPDTHPESYAKYRSSPVWSCCPDYTEAKSMIDSIYHDQEVMIYMFDKAILRGDSIILVNGESMHAPFTPHFTGYWVAFVDLYPLANEDERYEIVFIDLMGGGTIHRVKCNFYPKDIDKLCTLLRCDVCTDDDGLVDPLDLVFDKYKNQNNKKNKNKNQAAVDFSDKWAVIISGGYNINKNYVRYWNDCSLVYKTLRQNGYERDHIFVAMSDGQNDGLDMILNNGMYANSAWDLDADGLVDVQYSATYLGLEHLFTDLADRVNTHDEVFIFTTDHGQRENGSSVLNLWNNESITDTEFAQMLNLLNVEYLNIVMEQCYSGGFIDAVKNNYQNNFVITTSSTAQQLSYARLDKYYDEFIYWWCTAINEQSPSGVTYTNVDVNNDGFITMKEAYEFASNHDERDEFPQQYSSPFCLKYDLTLNEDIMLCDYESLGYDLMLKDNTHDFGGEPNTTTDKFWLCTDIWFEDLNGNRTDVLQQGQTYNVCARIYNRGDMTSPGGEKIYWHWTKAMIGGSWPYSWFNDYYYSCDGTPIVRGSQINPNGTILPPIDGGDSYVAIFQWTVQTPDYSVCSIFSDDIDELWHYCILARIVENDFQNEISEQQLPSFVLGSNNVALRNFTILSNSHLSVSGLPASIVGVTIPRNQSGFYNILVDIQDANLYLGDSTHIYLTLSPDLLYNWAMSGSGFSQITNDKFEIVSYNAVLEDFFISDSTFYPLKIEVDMGSISASASIDIYVSDNSGNIIGGHHFEYSGNDINTDDRQDPNKLYIEKEDNYLFYCEPNPAENYISFMSNEEIQHIEIYNQLGQLVLATGQTTINVSHFPQGLYLVNANVGSKMKQTKFIKR